jgi:hypothetical protein
MAVVFVAQLWPLSRRQGAGVVLLLYQIWSIENDDVDAVPESSGFRTGENRISGEKLMEDGCQIVLSFDRCAFPGKDRPRSTATAHCKADGKCASSFGKGTLNARTFSLSHRFTPTDET